MGDVCWSRQQSKEGIMVGVISSEATTSISGLSTLRWKHFLTVPTNAQRATEPEDFKTSLGLTTWLS